LKIAILWYGVPYRIRINHTDLPYAIIFFCFGAQYCDKNHNVNKQLIFILFQARMREKTALRHELAAPSV